jgi:hypothetical protein
MWSWRLRQHYVLKVKMLEASLCSIFKGSSFSAFQKIVGQKIEVVMWPSMLFLATV